MSKWIFVPNLDSIGNDILKAPPRALDVVPAEAVAVNTLGFVKNKVVFPLVPSAFYSPNDGIYIRRDVLPMDTDIYDSQNLEKYLLSNAN